MTSLAIIVPLLPPSVNHYKMRTRMGVTFVSDEAKAFKAALAVCARGESIAPADPRERRRTRYEVSIDIHLGPGRRGDLDNFAKVVLDGLAEANVIHSDDPIDLLILRKVRGADESRTVISVSRAGAGSADSTARSAQPAREAR